MIGLAERAGQRREHRAAGDPPQRIPPANGVNTLALAAARPIAGERWASTLAFDPRPRADGLS
jgi:hypothetical protein